VHHLLTTHTAKLKCMKNWAEQAVWEGVRDARLAEGLKGSLLGLENRWAKEIQVGGGIFKGAAEVAKLGTSPVPPAGAVARGGGVVQEPQEVVAQVVGCATGDEPGILEEVIGKQTGVDPFAREEELDLAAELLLLRRGDNLGVQEGLVDDRGLVEILWQWPVMANRWKARAFCSAAQRCASGWRG
jgi:hypothetical protein